MTPTPPMTVLTSAAAYFAIVFGAGFVLGVLRTLWLAPAVGPLWAVVIELPVILAVAWLACVRALRRWPLAPTQAAAMGVLAFVLLMAAEAALSLGPGGRSLVEHLALYARAEHQLGLAGQVVFAALPWLRARAGHAAARKFTAP